jgi:hypothetical protein
MNYLDGKKLVHFRNDYRCKHETVWTQHGKSKLTERWLIYMLHHLLYKSQRYVQIRHMYAATVIHRPLAMACEIRFCSVLSTFWGTGHRRVVCLIFHLSPWPVKFALVAFWAVLRDWTSEVGIPNISHITIGVSCMEWGLGGQYMRPAGLVQAIFFLIAVFLSHWQKHHSRLICCNQMSPTKAQPISLLSANYFTFVIWHLFQNTLISYHPNHLQ